MDTAAIKNFVKEDSDFHVTQPSLHPEISPQIKSQMGQISAVIAEILREGVKTGEFRDMDVQDASVVLGALLRGFYFRGPIQEKKYSIQETTDLLHSFFLNGIKKHKQAKKGGRK
jgi:hypothetical protein